LKNQLRKWAGESVVPLKCECQKTTTATKPKEPTDSLVETPTPAPTTPKSDPKQSKKDWHAVQDFLTKEEASALYEKMMAQPWHAHHDDGRDAFALYYGLSYQGSGGARPNEIPTEIPDFLKVLADRISQHTKTPVNYIQCHKYGPTAEVRPHTDPHGMVVPMLCVGQERTFRVGGKVVSQSGVLMKRWNQKVTKVEQHIPAEEILLRHGSLLVFDGGHTIHSMHVGCKDSQFNENGLPYRISVIFRYTTPAMREFGPYKAKFKGGDKQYKQAVKDWLKAQEPAASIGNRV
jgi:hypothetical protein